MQSQSRPHGTLSAEDRGYRQDLERIHFVFMVRRCPGIPGPGPDAVVHIILEFRSERIIEEYRSGVESGWNYRSVETNEAIKRSAYRDNDKMDPGA